MVIDFDDTRGAVFSNNNKSRPRNIDFRSASGFRCFLFFFTFTDQHNGYFDRSYVFIFFRPQRQPFKRGPLFVVRRDVLRTCGFIKLTGSFDHIRSANRRSITWFDNSTTTLLFRIILYTRVYRFPSDWCSPILTSKFSNIVIKTVLL